MVRQFHFLAFTVVLLLGSSQVLAIDDVRRIDFFGVGNYEFPSFGIVFTIVE